MRSMVFCKRVTKEILRDPLSYIFCLGFPIVMLIIMTIVNESIPPQAGMDIFGMGQLAPGMAFFGLSFVMIFICIQVSTDRNTSLLMRLHASPMQPVNFIAGYTLPVLVISLLQTVITYVASIVVGFVVDYSFSVLRLLLSILYLIPSMVIFISIGLIFGTLLNEKAAPGICSIIITVVGMLGGIWMPVDNIGGTVQDISKVMPFYHGVKVARLVVAGSYEDAWKPVLVTLAWAVVLYVLAVVVMHGKLKRDIR